MNLFTFKLKQNANIIFNISIFLVICIVLVWGGHKYYSIEAHRIRNNKYQEIKTITDLKVDQILAWKKERFADACQFSESPIFIKAFGQWRVTNDTSLKNDLIIRLRLIKQLRGVENILVVSPDKKKLISTGPEADFLSSYNSGSLDYALLYKKIYISDLDINTQPSKVQMVISAPIINNGKTIAVVLLQINPYQYLFPLLQKWPTSSKSAEAILVGRRDNRAFFINELRHKTTTLKEGVPITQKDNLAVQAVMGYQGILEGKDYRGVEVLSYIRGISGTPWYIIAQIDKTEVYSELRYRAGITIAFTAVFVLLCAFAMLGYYHYRQKNIYKQLLNKDLALTKQEEELLTILYSISSGVITTDTSCRVKRMNPEAERLTGWKERKASGKPIDEIFRIIDGKTRQEISNPAQEAIKKGMAIEPVPNTILVSKDGLETPITNSSAPIKTKKGELLGVVLVFKNQTRDHEIQKTLEENEAKLTSAELISHTGYWEYNLNTGHIKGSAGARKIYGLNDTELDFSEVQSFPLPEYREKLDLAMQRLLKYNEPYRETFKIKQYGTGKIIDIYSIAKFDKNKNIVIGTVQNITSRVKAEEELAQQHNLLRILVDSMPDYVYVKDLNSRFLLANNFLAQGFGASVDEIIGKSDFDYFPASMAQEFFEEEQALFKTGIPVINKEQTIVDHSGYTRILLTTKLPMRDSQGQIIGLAGTGHDITDRKIVEQALKLSEEKYRFLIENANEAIFVIQEEVILFVNRKMEEITGYSMEEITSSPFYSFIHPEDAQFAHDNYLKRVQGIDTSANNTYRIIHRSGDTRWINVNSTLIDWEGKPATLNFISDITRQKHTEQEIIRARDRAERSDKLKTAFLQNMSHEIRTPLNAIVGFANLLDQSDISHENQKEFVEIIINSSNQLLSIIDDVLTVARIQTGHEIVTSTPTRVNEILNNLYTIFKPQATDKGIDLILHKQIETSHFTIVTDSTKLTQIITNLLNNAFKFTHNGSIEFGYTLKTDFIEFFVKDTGIGIAPEVQEVIFERFAQANSSIPLQYGGTGLGLSISKGYAEIQGGSLCLTSTPGQGSTFFLTLPIKLTNEPEFQPIIPKPTIYRIPKTILIAEDETFNYLLIKEFLANSNSTLLFAHNGREAIEICRQNPKINLVLMDIKMPEMDGLTAMKEIKIFRPHLPIIAQTAYALEHEKQKFLYSGFDDYISKPIKKEELLEKIDALYTE
ncbi:MAG: PAS domain S-box protein [Bacteroidota bacterium]|nr:PAS domain S-box protein [Bacteroidota bacterium]